MYKTVRHGENSLQYKILAQHEDGIANVRCRKSTRGKTAGIITVVLLLVCGVIATAVLVPLVLTNDFITLTGTFQKFSVSTLRRSHSGNHVVVIAKKPHGWNSSRHNMLQPSTRATLTSTYYLYNKAEQPHASGGALPTMESSNEFPTTPKTIYDKIHMKVTIPEDKITSADEKTFKKKFKVSTAFLSDRNTESNVDTMTKVTSTSTPVGEHIFLKKEISSTKTSPVWNHNSKWSFETPSSFIRWSDKIPENSLSTIIGGFCAIAVIIIVAVVLMKCLPNKRKLIQKKLAETKEDKARLLKTSCRASDEE